MTRVVVSPQVGYGRVAAAVAGAGAGAPRCAGAAPCARARCPSRGARASSSPLARTRAPPYLPSPFRAPARSTAHATRAQILLPDARSSAHFPVRSPNVWMSQCQCNVRT